MAAHKPEASTDSKHPVDEGTNTSPLTTLETERGPSTERDKILREEKVEDHVYWEDVDLDCDAGEDKTEAGESSQADVGAQSDCQDESRWKKEEPVGGEAEDDIESVDLSAEEERGITKSRMKASLER